MRRKYLKSTKRLIERMTVRRGMPNKVAKVSREGSHCVVCLLKWSIRALATRFSVTDKSGARLIDLKAINISSGCGSICHPKSYRIASLKCCEHFKLIGS